MPDRSRLTQWFTWRHRPRRAGIYQVMWMSEMLYSHWNGRLWCVTGTTENAAHANRHWKTVLPIRAWRGRTRP